jgi:hypothetical protein
MTFENSSLLGYVFIISGFALVILAYAIYLNLRGEKSSTRGIDENLVIETEGPTPIEESLQSNAPIIETPISSGVDSSLESREIDKKGPDIEMRPSEVAGVNMPKEQELISVATILREIDSGRLILRIGEKDYASFEDLKASPHLSRIERLYSDLENWLKPTDKSASGIGKVVSKATAVEMDPSRPLNMVDEINEILDHRLRDESGERKAIKLVEMLDGGVNVYIGVDSYPIDKVPDEDVRQLIREAVAEWEQKR